uniref:Uncharacterized protein n=1 Tax=Avena sativa TaxID=4498 RepID=A0ACD5TL60_AVESA
MPKQQGGLGVRNLSLHNKALMANLLSKLLSDSEGPCFSWLARRYLRDSIPQETSRGDTPFWRSLLALLPTVQNATRCRPSTGDKISFWHDQWTDLGHLKDRFSVLFTFAKDQHCTVRSQQRNGDWDIDLLLPLTDSAQLQLEQLMQRIHLIQLDGVGDEREMITTGKPPSTAAFYRLFSDRGMKWQPAEWVWRKAIPHRHKIFTWLSFRGRLNTKDNMTAKCWCSDAGCDLCPALESIHHIALHCKTSTWVWEKLNVAETAATSNTMAQFVTKIQALTGDSTWPTCFAACLLELWKARNDRIFNGRSMATATILMRIRETLRLWTCRSPKEGQRIMTWAQKLS